MSYRTILAFLPDTATADRLLPVATTLARQQDSHLTGLYVMPAMTPIAFTGYESMDVTGTLMTQHENFHAERSAQVRANFERQLAAETLPHDWAFVRSAFADILPAIMDHGRTAQLMIVGDDRPEATELPEIAIELALHAGRPVLLLPKAPTSATIGRDIVVAWDGGREAARAVFDALPLLQTADIVRILCVDPALGTGESRSRAGDGLAASLARCGATCETVDATAGHGTVAEEILARAADYGSDLLVMGAFGHSRFREWALGGVTRAILQELPLPVLLSH